MKVIKLRSGKFRIIMSCTEFTALQHIVDYGREPAKKEVGGRGFGAFDEGLNVTDDRSNEPVPLRTTPGFGTKRSET